jgi:hypothetical protein
MAVIFFLVLTLMPWLSKSATPVTWDGLMQNRQFLTLLLFLLGYSIVYPFVAFTNQKRHLNGTYADNSELIEKVLHSLQYEKTEESKEKVVFRRRSKLARFVQWYEDAVELKISENPVIISGMRKHVNRINRMIEQELIRKGD